MRVTRKVLPILLALQASVTAGQQSGGSTLSAFQRAKTESLLEHKLPCLGCHTLNGRGGRIGPDLSGVGARLQRDRIRQQIEDPRAALPGGNMPRIPLPPATLDLVVRYLSEQRAEVAPRAPVTSAAPVPARTAGQQLYYKHCAACHGWTGQGDGWNAAQLDRPPARHADARTMSLRTDDRLFDAIHAGSSILGGSARMPPFGQTLSAQEIRLLVGHIRQLCRCRQPAWADAAR
ncbi:MAG: c-type cytochrome [Longimicrobiales bacterium]